VLVLPLTVLHILSFTI